MINQTKSKNRINLFEEDMLTQITNFCIKSKQTFNDLNDQIRKIKEFHTEKLGDKAAQFATGTGRVEALKNLEDISTGLDNANNEVKQILQQLKQVRSLTQTKQPGMGLSQASTTAEEDDEK